jgi:D-alanyl-D-alanine-carboxypeptidase/D-alanyl-D-alanine-endopeptidase
VLAQLVARARRRGHLSLAAGVALPGGECRLLGGGADGVYEIGSITKPLTGVLLADAVGRGDVRFGDLLTAHVSYEAAPLAWPERVPTLEELATHASGLPNTPKRIGRREVAFVLGLRSRDPWEGIDDGEYQRLLVRTPVKRLGGFRYSSVGFGLLGDALANAAGTSYERLLRERLCEPLGLDDTWIDPPAEVSSRVLVGHTRRGRSAPPLRDLMPAAGSVRSTTADMLRLLQASLEPPEDGIGPALAAAAAPRRRLARGASIGLGWLVVERRKKPPVVWHNGGTWGFRSFAGFVPQTGAAAVVLTNTFKGVERLGYELLDAAS